jgi:hypothetical protein
MKTRVLSVEALVEYARCSLAWWWSLQDPVVSKLQVADLFEESLRDGLRLYYTGAADRLSEAVVQVWGGWCQAWGDSVIAGDLARYAKTRGQILSAFESGQIKNFSGERYRQPRMSNSYRQLYHDRGLTALGRRLDDFARLRGLEASGDDTEFRVPGSPLGDAFADAVTAAERMRSADVPLPDRSIVRGLDIAYGLALTPTLLVEGSADLVATAPADNGVQLEVHDFAIEHGLRTGQAARDLRVIAALLGATATGELTWTRVSRVVLRIWRTGECHVVSEPNPGHLLNLVAVIARGMEHQIVIPQALNGYPACRACDYRSHCWSPEGWRGLPLVAPGLLPIDPSLSLQEAH